MGTGIRRAKLPYRVDLAMRDAETCGSTVPAIGQTTWRNDFRPLEPVATILSEVDQDGERGSP